MERKELHLKGFQVLVAPIIDGSARRRMSVKLFKDDKEVELICNLDAVENNIFTIHKELFLMFQHKYEGKGHVRNKSY